MGDSVNVSWNSGYIVASFCVAWLGSGTALQVMKYRTGSSGWKNWLHLLGGAICLGAVGIWCMHFIGMAALRLEHQGQVLRIGYHGGWTVFSLFMAVLFIVIAFRLAGDPNYQAWWKHLLGGLLGGGGVAVMHYTGMMAMQVEVKMEYDAGFVILAIVVGILASTAALLIFFRWYYLWNRSIFAHLLASFIMAGAVCAMHYTGMHSCTYVYKRKHINFDTSDTTIVIVVLVVSLVVCLAFLVLVYFRWQQLSRIESLKAQCLTMNCLVVDSNGRFLQSLTGSLPSAVIETSYVGHGTFDHNNSDFLRMLKTSFNWADLPRYKNQVRKMINENLITPYSFELFSKFEEAANQLARTLHIPVTSLGVMYVKPRQAIVTVVMRTRNTDRMDAGGCRWVDRGGLVTGLLSSIGNVAETNEWVDTLLDYYDKVTQPIIGGKTNSTLIDMLKKVALQLGVDTEEAPKHVKAWRDILGIYVNDKPHLNRLVAHREQWARVALDPMVKVEIEHTLMADYSAMGDSTMSNLYMGIFYVQVNGAGLQVMVPESGPYSMVPMVKFGRAEQFTSAQVNWLKKVCKLKIRTFPGVSSSFSFARAGGHSPGDRADSPFADLMPAPNSPESAVFGHPIDNKDADYQFKQDFLAGVQMLSNILGTDRDLTPANLHDQILDISPDIKVVMFVVSAMNTGPPTDYHRGNFNFLPLKVFEVVHFSQRIAHQAPGWPRKLLDASLQDRSSLRQDLSQSSFDNEVSTNGIITTQHRESVNSRKKPRSRLLAPTSVKSRSVAPAPISISISPNGNQSHAGTIINVNGKAKENQEGRARGNGDALAVGSDASAVEMSVNISTAQSTVTSPITATFPPNTSPRRSLALRSGNNSGSRPGSATANHPRIVINRGSDSAETSTPLDSPPLSISMSPQPGAAAPRFAHLRSAAHSAPSHPNRASSRGFSLNDAATTPMLMNGGASSSMSSEEGVQLPNTAAPSVANQGSYVHPSRSSSAGGSLSSHQSSNSSNSNNPGRGSGSFHFNLPRNAGTPSQSSPALSAQSSSSSQSQLHPVIRNALTGSIKSNDMGAEWARHGEHPMTITEEREDLQSTPSSTLHRGKSFAFLGGSTSSSTSSSQHPIRAPVINPSTTSNSPENLNTMPISSSPHRSISRQLASRSRANIGTQRFDEADVGDSDDELGDMDEGDGAPLTMGRASSSQQPSPTDDDVASPRFVIRSSNSNSSRSDSGLNSGNNSRSGSGNASQRRTANNSAGSNRYAGATRFISMNNTVQMNQS